MEDQSCLELFMRKIAEDRKIRCGKVSLKDGEWLESLEEFGLSMGIIRFFQWHWVLESDNFNCVDVEPVTIIAQEKDFLALIEDGFFCIGVTGCGSFFVLDMRSEGCQPGFLPCHNYSESNEVDPRKEFEPVARNFQSWLYRVMENKFTPMDYYEAKDFNEFLRGEQKWNCKFNHLWNCSSPKVDIKKD